jgi:hypothetical protein
LLGRQIVVFAPLRRAPRAPLVVNQIRLAIVGTLAVGPAIHLHLEKAEINPKLQFFATIEARNFPDFYCAGFMRPIFQQAV